MEPIRGLANLLECIEGQPSTAQFIENMDFKIQKELASIVQGARLLLQADSHESKWAAMSLLEKLQAGIITTPTQIAIVMCHLEQHGILDRLGGTKRCEARLMTQELVAVYSATNDDTKAPVPQVGEYQEAYRQYAACLNHIYGNDSLAPGHAVLPLMRLPMIWFERSFHAFQRLT